MFFSPARLPLSLSVMPGSHTITPPPKRRSHRAKGPTVSSIHVSPRPISPSFKLLPRLKTIHKMRFIRSVLSALMSVSGSGKFHTLPMRTPRKRPFVAEERRKVSTNNRCTQCRVCARLQRKPTTIRRQLRGPPTLRSLC